MHISGSSRAVSVSRQGTKRLLLVSSVMLFSFQAIAGTPVTWYADLTNPGLEDGSALKPFNTLDEALNAAGTGDTVMFTTSAMSHETPTINQSVTINASGGKVTIGKLGAQYGSGTPFEAIKITELMFNPKSGKAEFLELQNTSSSSVDMSGAYFSAGISYTFPASTTIAAGAYAVLVRDADEVQFVADYGFPPLGFYVGNLDNGGERLAINDSSDNTFYELTYNDGSSWPDLADGVGHSMVIIDPHGDGDSGSNWRASNVDGGNPGFVDVDPNTPGILINEALAHVDPGQPEKIELYNPTGAPVDISGWFLSDDRSEPFQAKIAPSTIINAGAYLQLRSDVHFGPGSGTGQIGGQSLPGFLLSSHGEDVFLFASDNNDNLTGYAHGWGFGGSENGVSFGREVTSDGREHFVSQTAQSFWAANAGPAVGPLVISKVHYHPLSNGVEFIEITNTSGSTVNLYDDAGGGDPNNTYKVSGIGFKFPTGQSIAAGDTILIVNGDPAVYDARFGTPAGITMVYGPFGNDPDASSDALSNTGETIQILWPDVPDLGVAAYISMDKVRYNDVAPWPLAPDGTGSSLDRLVDTTFGSEPTNWTSALPVHQPEVQVEDVLFSTQRGFYDTTVNLTLSTTTIGDQIFYTDDGTVPDNTDTLYTGPIPITTNTPIRATAVLAGYIDAPVETHTYIIGAPTHQKGVRALTIVADPQESLYHPNGIMAINGGAYRQSTFNTLIWGPHTYDTLQAPLDDPNTGPVDVWMDPLGSPVYPLVGGGTVDNTAYHNPAGLAGVGGVEVPTAAVSMEKPASFEMLYPDGTPGLQENAGVRVAGSSFHRPRYGAHPDGSGDWTTKTQLGGDPESTLASYLKISMRMYFRSEYGASKLDWPIFPGDLLQNYDKIVLRGGHNDGQNPFIKDEFTRRLFIDTGNINARGTIVNLYINGVYKGWYNATERLDSKFFQSRYGGSQDYDRMVHVDDKVAQRYNFTPWNPELKEGDFVAYHAMMTAVEEDLSIQGNYDAVAAMLDIPQFIDYILVQLLVGNDDWPNNNWTAARERVPGGKFRFYVWDAESTFYTANAAKSGLRSFPFWMWTDPTPPASVAGGSGLFGEQTPIAAIFRGLYDNAGFRTQFSDRAVVLLDNTTGPLGDTNVAARYNELKTEMIATLKPSLTFNDHIGTNWLPTRRATLISLLQAEGLYPGP